MPTPTEKAIISRFGSEAENPEILSSLVHLLKVFDFDVDELHINWETFCYSRPKNVNDDDDSQVKLNSDNITSLQQYILKNIEKKGKSTNHAAIASAKKTRRMISSPMGAMFDMLPSTPMSASKRKLAAPHSDRSKKTQRNSMLSSSPIKVNVNHSEPMDDISIDIDSPAPSSLRLLAEDSLAPASTSGEVFATLNSNVKEGEGLDLTSEEKKANNVQLAANFDPAKFKFRIMRQKLLEAADVLDDQIDTLASIVTAATPGIEIGNPNTVSQEDTVVVGRITPDSPLTTYDQTLNKESLCLEPSRSGGIGQRVKLNLSTISNYSFFPGQIVALKGRNANGKYFTVNEVLDTPLLGSPTSTFDELEQYKENLEGSDLKIAVTAGPYTTNENLDFTYLNNFVDKINTEIKPHYVIMFGPFIDYSHPKVVDGSIESYESSQGHPKTLDDVFRVVISPILKRIDPRVQVILLPSTKDVSSKHPSYPQDALERKALSLGKNFKCFPNPASFQLNECLIGASNNDIFKDLRDVVDGDASQINRFDRITNYILEQRRFYPLFPGGLHHQKIKLITPPPDSADFKVLHENEEDVNKISKGKGNNNTPDFEIQQVGGADLDIPYLGLTEFTDATPDILIIPSQLKFFARVVKNVVVINPGYFMKPKRNGSYAVLNIEAPRVRDEDEENGKKCNVTKVDGEEDLYLHDVWKRCRVDIVST